jgi:hypothetical protein
MFRVERATRPFRSATRRTVLEEDAIKINGANHVWRAPPFRPAGRRTAQASGLFHPIQTVAVRENLDLPVFFENLAENHWQRDAGYVMREPRLAETEFVLRPPSSQPSPQGEGETLAAVLKYSATGSAEWPCESTENAMGGNPLLGERIQVRASQNID